MIDLKQHQIYGKIIENTPNGIIVSNSNNEMLFMNYAMEKILDEARISVSGDIYKALPQLKKIELNNKTIQTIKIDKTRWHVYGMQLKEKWKTLNIFILLDIYESFITQNELDANRNMVDELKEILEGSYDGILVTDGEGNVLHVNKSYERVAAIKVEDILGHNMKELINPVWMPNSVAFVVIKEKKAVSKRQITKDGRNIIVTGVPIFDKEGNVKKVIINARDITEIYQLREELLKSKELEKAYMKNYSDFIELIKIGKEQVLASSQEMQDALKLAEKVSNFSTTILVLGESGVGKEEIAKFIHRSSLRKNEPFITINCGAIPSNLLESELFGYEKGAFTGASAGGKAGLLEMADGGTVFLDAKEIRRVGSTLSKVIDVRIIAATNKNLEEMIVDGSFREDLFYRLNVVQIKVAPLRDRVDDILPLGMYFLAQYNQKYQQNKRLTYDVMKELEAFSWPGNVRQLKNIIENMTVISNNEYLQVEDLPWHKKSDKSVSKTEVDQENADKELSLNEALDELEKSILKQAKEKYKNTRTMAEHLKLDQSTIVRKMNKHGI